MESKFILVFIVILMHALIYDDIFSRKNKYKHIKIYGFFLFI